MRTILFLTIPAIFLILTSYFLTLKSEVHGFGSSSTNYNLEGEFGIFGGAKSSTNYNLTDTGGGFAVGFGSSANYGSGSGFQYVLAEIREIIFTISSTSVNLGTINSTAKGVPQTITVTVNGAGGYKVTVLEDDNLCRIVLPCDSANDIDDVSGGTVDDSNEEYGLGTSKSGQYFAQESDCTNTPFNATAIDTTPRQVASSSLPIDSDTTTLCYSAATSGTTAAGSYSQILTYIATGTF